MLELKNLVVEIKTKRMIQIFFLSNYFAFAYDSVSVTIPSQVHHDLKKGMSEKKADFGHFNSLNWSKVIVRPASKPCGVKIQNFKSSWGSRTYCRSNGELLISWLTDEKKKSQVGNIYIYQSLQGSQAHARHPKCYGGWFIEELDCSLSTIQTSNWCIQSPNRQKGFHSQIWIS